MLNVAGHCIEELGLIQQGFEDCLNGLECGFTGTRNHLIAPTDSSGGIVTVS